MTRLRVAKPRYRAGSGDKAQPGAHHASRTPGAFCGALPSRQRSRGKEATSTAAASAERSPGTPSRPGSSAPVAGSPAGAAGGTRHRQCLSHPAFCAQTDGLGFY